MTTPPDPTVIDLTDPDLFGNDAGEDEAPDVLASYFVDKASFKTFSNINRRFAVVRARKGFGKSALLSKVAYEIGKYDSSAIVISVKGSDLTSLGEFSSSDPSVLINQWQQVICARINLEIGKSLDFAFTDVSMAMIEAAELSNFKERNLFGSLIERLKPKLKLGPIEIEPGKSKVENSFYLLSNHAKDLEEAEIWIFVDDVDSTYLDNQQMRLKVATFFSACRKLSTDVKGLNIRASVRTDVWTDVRRVDEALDKCEQYMIDIVWTRKEAERILANKVHSYVKRVHPGSNLALNWEDGVRPEYILHTVFPQQMEWSGGTEYVSTVVNILSAGRPRWAGQLCRLAAIESATMGYEFVAPRALTQVLKKYGRYRLDDLYKEHSHQLPELQAFIESFAGGPRRYTTQSLMDRVESVKLSEKTGNELPTIYGRSVESVLELCQFLFKIGFISGRLEGPNDRLEFVRYEDRPELLQDPNNIDDGLDWEVHPTYRKVLNM